MVRTNPSDAAKLFEHAIELDPSNRETRQALGFVYIALADYERALQQFSAVQDIRRSDTLQLQIGYTLLALYRTNEAYKIFHELTGSLNPDIREKAEKQLAYESSASQSSSSTQTVTPHDWLTRIYSASYYDTRWETSFFNLTAEEGYTLPSARTVSLYGVLSLSADTRSSAGLVPEIFSDNTLLMGVGIRVRPFPGFSLSAQQGVGFDLIGRKDIDFSRPDFRLVTVYGWGIYAPYTFHPEARFPFFPTFDLYGSVGAYSRYKNTIGYLQIKGGVRVMEVSRTVLDIYAKANFARDAAINLFENEPSVKPKEYYNNLDEFGVGARVTPNVDWGLYLVGEYLRGLYSIEAMVPSSRDRYYDSFRVYLIFDRTF
ncbi:MAG: tetratricopeptide repeat protein [Ignavibacteriae bacterium]|nr:tetratricopeptide repeat protein [Ignavibacteria bacterium]MBI3365257.1 tetratricopeptide repeat protein [Ignavibacteriota bacterium]